MSIRSAASCGHPLQVSLAPRGALTWRLAMLMIDWRENETFERAAAAKPRAEGKQSRNVRGRCQFETEKFLT
jgi:hypothetical protein